MKWVLDLLQSYAEKVGVFLLCLAEIAVCFARNQYPPLAEPFGAVEIQGSLHGLNLKVDSGDLPGYLDGLVRRVGWECASIVDDCFERD
jgi:hypothetical protein